jgi:hypothetical protein
MPLKYIHTTLYDGEDISELLQEFLYRGNSLYLVNLKQDLGLDTKTSIRLRYQFVKKNTLNGGIDDDQYTPVVFQKVIFGGDYPILINFLTHLENLLAYRFN